MSKSHNMIHVTDDLQDGVLSNLLKSSYYLSLAKSEIEVKYFTDPIARVIYKALCLFYDKYSNLPSAQELMVDASSLAYDYNVDCSELREMVAYYFGLPPAEDDTYVFNILGDFIRKSRLNHTLEGTLETLTNSSGNKINLDSLSSDLLYAINVDFGKAQSVSLSDPKALKEMRKSSYAGEVIKSSFSTLNSCLQYRGYLKRNLHMVVSAPGRGKTSFLINEGASAAHQGKTVLNVFLGDMLEYDGWVRYVSCITGLTQERISRKSDDEQAELINAVNAEKDDILTRINVLSYAANELTVDQLIERIKNEQKKKEVMYDMIIVDYADNLIQEQVSSYEAWGVVYNKLAMFSRKNNSVLMVASQPSKGYWSDEVIPMEGAAESSKKTHVVDLMITLGLVTNTATVGSMYLAKVRRGKTGYTIRFKTDWERCKIQEIPEEEYCALKSNYETELPSKKKGSFY